MLESKRFTSVIHDLEDDDEELIAILNRLIKFMVNYVNNSEELREEIRDYDDIFQIIVSDINFNFWIRVSNGTIFYKRGINRNASFKVIYTKKLFIKIIKREKEGTDAYMRGKIKVDGNLTQALKFIKFFRFFMKYNQHRERMR